MTMRLVFARLAASAVMVAFLPWAAARAADAGDFAPENIEKTDKFYNRICFVRAVCPLSDDARALIKKAMAGDRKAEYLLGLTLLTGKGLPNDRNSGEAWVVRAAEHGDASATIDIAGRLRNGSSLKVDETKIADALKPQAAAGDLEAMRALAPMYMGGRGTRQEPALVLSLLKQAADKGSSDAEKDLSQVYLHGAPGVAPNRPEALRWLAVSARHGNVDAMLNLGYMSMSTPIGVPSSQAYLAEGYCWLVRAALLDHPQAHEKLSMIFATGEKDSRGTTIAIDLIQADYWFRVAARSPYHDNSQIRAMSRK